MNLGFVNSEDPHAVRRAFQTLQDGLGFGASPTFTGLTLTGLTASRLIATDASKALESTDLNSWVSGTANEINITDDGDGTITIGIVDPLIVGKGGTGAATLTDHGILLGSGTGAITALGAATNGQIPIGSTGVDPVLAAITGTAKRVTVTNGAGTITLSGPQDLDTVDSPTFDGLNLTSAIVWSDTNLYRLAANTLKTDDNFQCNTVTSTNQGEFGGTIRATGTVAPASGEGLELFYGTPANSGRIAAYDRTGAAYKDLYIDANNLYLNTLSENTVTIGDITISPTTFQHQPDVDSGSYHQILDATGNYIFYVNFVTEKIGVGHNNPLAQIHIKDDDSASQLAEFRTENDNGAIAQFGSFGSLAASYGEVAADTVFFSAYGTTDFLFLADNAGGTIRFATGASGGTERARISSGGGFYLTELAAADADIAGKGQIWIKNDTPNTIWFTDDGGTDHQLGTAIDEKVKIDSAATADYIGATSSDGVLRTGSGLSYTDGGNYVTLDTTEQNPSIATSAYLGSNQLISTGSITLIQLDTENFDLGSDFNTGTYTFTCDTTGYYLVSAAGALTGMSIGDIANFYVYVNSGAIATIRFDAYVANQTARFNFSKLIYLTSTDTVDIRIWHDHGSNLTLASGTNNTWMTIFRVTR